MRERQLCQRASWGFFILTPEFWIPVFNAQQVAAVRARPAVAQSVERFAGRPGFADAGDSLRQ